MISQILIDEAGRVLREENADASQNPASLTKLMTLYLAFRDLPFDRRLTVPKAAVVRRVPGRVPQSNMRLRAGQSVSVLDLVLGMIGPSANDAATTVAAELAPDGDFVARLDAEAAALGLVATRFASPSGLGEGRSTARDMALLSRRLWEDFPAYRTLFSIGGFTFNGRRLGNTNDLLVSLPGLVGLKTGTMANLRRNLAALHLLDGRPLFSVVMNAENRAERDALTRRLLAGSRPDALRGTAAAGAEADRPPVAGDDADRGAPALLLADEAGAVLFEDRADTRLPPASLAKMMTLYLVFRHLPFDRRLTVPDRAEIRPPARPTGRVPQSRMGLKAGQRVSVLDLVLGMIVSSANDAAVTIAEAMAPGGFVDLMNAEAGRLGLRSTRFVSPSGRGGGETTARDMSILARRLWADFPHYRSLFSIESFDPGTGRQTSTNTLLTEIDHVIGLKTGTTGEGRCNLAATWLQDGRTCFTLVMNAADVAARDDLSRSLFERFAPERAQGSAR